LEDKKVSFDEDPANKLRASYEKLNAQGILPRPPSPPMAGGDSGAGKNCPWCGNANIEGVVSCRICGKNVGDNEEYDKLQQNFAKKSGLEWITQKKGHRGPLGLTKDYARKAQKSATKWAKTSCPEIAETATIHDRWMKDEWFKTTMIENGYDENQILGMDALNKAPRPSEETLNKNRWSKDYRDERLQGTQTIRRTDKTGGAGTIARSAEPDFEEVLSKKPKNEYKAAGGDSGTSSSSNQWGQSSWKPKSQIPDRSSGSGDSQWRPPVESDADIQRRMRRFMDKESPTGDQGWQSRWQERQ
jgi:hypothetical protein